MEKLTMNYRALGKTGIKVSAVGIETHQWSGMGGRFFSVKNVRAILKRAEKSGITFIDTGECYFFHAAERLIGEALGNNRKRWIIATKFGHISKPREVVPAWTAEDIKRQLDDSLRALSTSCIDLYQAHLNSPEDALHIRENMHGIGAVLREAKRARKIHIVGICVGDDDIFDEKGELLKSVVKEWGVESVQVLYSRLDKRAEKYIFPITKKYKLGIIARAPLAKGYLSTRFKPTNKTYDAKRMAEVEKIKTTEVPVGVDLSEWAIAWCLKTNNISTVVPGCSAPEQIDSTVRASTIRI